MGTAVKVLFVTADQRPKALSKTERRMDGFMEMADVEFKEKLGWPLRNLPGGASVKPQRAVSGVPEAERKKNRKQESSL